MATAEGEVRRDTAGQRDTESSDFLTSSASPTNSSSAMASAFGGDVRQKNTGVGDSPGTNPAKMGTTTPIRNVKYVRTAARAAATVAGWRARMLLLLLLLLPLGMRKSFSLLFIHSFIFTQAGWPIKTTDR